MKLLGNLKEKDCLRNLVIDGRILKWTLNGVLEFGLDS
jgi:hypothetical protein